MKVISKVNRIKKIKFDISFSIYHLKLPHNELNRLMLSNSINLKSFDKFKLNICQDVEVACGNCIFDILLWPSESIVV